jgi:hypothetical protein
MTALFVLALLAAEQPSADYDLVTSPAAPVLVGKRATVSLSIVPRTGRRLKASAPVIVHITGDGVTVERELMMREHAVDPKAEAPRFELAFSPTRAGAARLEASVTFYVCLGRRCRPVEDRATWTLEAKAQLK